MPPLAISLVVAQRAATYTQKKDNGSLDHKHFGFLFPSIHSVPAILPPSTPPTTLKKETLCDDVIRSRMMRREKCVLNVRQQGKPRDFVSKAKLLFEGVRLNT